MECFLVLKLLNYNSINLNTELIFSAIESTYAGSVETDYAEIRVSMA